MAAAAAPPWASSWHPSPEVAEVAEVEEAEAEHRSAKRRASH